MLTFIASMKWCLTILITFGGLLNQVYGQSPSAAIDSLIKYGIITGKQRLVIERELKDKGGASYRVAILGGLENIMLKKEFHVDPHRTGISISYGDGHLNKKSQDSINAFLRPLLEEIKKAGLLTDRVYTYALEGIDTGRYMEKLQLIGTLTEMSSRLEWLAPNRLQPVAEELHKNGIVTDSSFLRLTNDISNGKIESASQLNDYCRLDRTFDLTKYADDPNVWLEQIHRDIASMLPPLNFTDFSYTTVPDTSFTLSGTRFRVSLTCNGHTYKYTSLAFTNFKSRQGKILPKDIFTEDFYRIFNKVLTDQQSPLRLHAVMFIPGKTTNDHFRYFALIALNKEQAEVFMTPPCVSYMMVSLDNYDSTQTSARRDSTIAEWRKIGLFAHLSNAQISKAIDNAEADDVFSIDYLLVNFPGVVYSLDSALRSYQRNPYSNLLSHLAKITHGAFNPTEITQRKVNHGIKLQYLFNGKTHSYTFSTANGWLDDDFQSFVKGLGVENNLPGDFYPLQLEEAVIYLTKQQHEDVVKYKLLGF